MTEFFKKKNLLFLFLLLFVIGLLLVLFSQEDKKEEETVSSELEFDEERYEEMLEKRLKTIIEKMDGVGEVSVMVTLEGSALYTYAIDTTQDISPDGDSKKESTVVLSTTESSNKQAVISGYTLPKVKGASVVCSNTLSATQRSNVISVVSAALGISSAKICVTN